MYDYELKKLNDDQLGDFIGKSNKRKADLESAEKELLLKKCVLEDVGERVKRLGDPLGRGQECIDRLVREINDLTSDIELETMHAGERDDQIAAELIRRGLPMNYPDCE